MDHVRQPMLCTTLALLALLVLGGCGSDTSTTSTPTTAGRSGTSSTSMGGAGTSRGLPIPDSTAVDAITKDLTKPAASDLTAKCDAFATAFRANADTGGDEVAVMDALDELAGVVRPIDPAVADALVSHPGAAAAWCKAKGMTRS